MREICNQSKKLMAAKYQGIIRESVEFVQLKVAYDDNSSLIHYEDADNKFHLFEKIDEQQM